MEEMTIGKVKEIQERIVTLEEDTGLNELTKMQERIKLIESKLSSIEKDMEGMDKNTGIYKVMQKQYDKLLEEKEYIEKMSNIGLIASITSNVFGDKYKVTEYGSDISNDKKILKEEPATSQNNTETKEQLPKTEKIMSVNQLEETKKRLNDIKSKLISIQENLNTINENTGIGKVLNKQYEKLLIEKKELEEKINHDLVIGTANNAFKTVDNKFNLTKEVVNEPKKVKTDDLEKDLPISNIDNSDDKKEIPTDKKELSTIVKPIVKKIIKKKQMPKNTPKVIYLGKIEDIDEQDKKVIEQPSREVVNEPSKEVIKEIKKLEEEIKQKQEKSISKEEKNVKIENLEIVYDCKKYRYNVYFDLIENGKKSSIFDSWHLSKTFLHNDKVRKSISNKYNRKNIDLLDMNVLSGIKTKIDKKYNTNLSADYCKGRLIFNLTYKLGIPKNWLNLKDWLKQYQTAVNQRKLGYKPKICYSKEMLMRLALIGSLLGSCGAPIISYAKDFIDLSSQGKFQKELELNDDSSSMNMDKVTTDGKSNNLTTEEIKVTEALTDTIENPELLKENKIKVESGSTNANIEKEESHYETEASGFKVGQKLKLKQLDENGNVTVDHFVSDDAFDKNLKSITEVEETEKKADYYKISEIWVLDGSDVLDKVCTSNIGTNELFEKYGSEITISFVVDAYSNDKETLLYSKYVNMDEIAPYTKNQKQKIAKEKEDDKKENKSTEISAEKRALVLKNLRRN